MPSEHKGKEKERLTAVKGVPRGLEGGWETRRCPSSFCLNVYPPNISHVPDLKVKQASEESSVLDWKD